MFDQKFTLDMYYDRWEEMMEGTVRDSTIRSIGESYKRITSCLSGPEGKAFGRSRLDGINKESILFLKKSLTEKYSTATVNSTLALLRRILNDAMDDELIDKNPCNGIKALRRKEITARESVHRALDRKETKAFFRNAEGSGYYELYRFLIFSGVRCGEAGAILFTDIKNDVIEIRRTITRNIRGYEIGDDVKTGAGRRDIPLTAELREICIARKARKKGKHEELLFCSPYGRLIIPSNVDKDIKKICIKAGIEPFTAHAFRDTFATRAIESGMNPKTLQELLGHSSYGITMTLYAHVMPETKSKEMGKVKFHI